MKHIRLAAGVAAAALLSACATQAERPPLTPVLPLEVALGNADAALRAGHTEQAVTILHSAAREHPADKAPLLRIAQMRYDRGEYGDAIVQAQAALQREPDNLLAHSIVAVSGLRVASKALSDLAGRNNLTGSVRTEAEDLARLLRTSLGEDALVGAGARKQQATPAPSMHRKSASNERPSRSSSASDPFGALK